MGLDFVVTHWGIRWNRGGGSLRNPRVWGHIGPYVYILCFFGGVLYNAMISRAHYAATLVVVLLSVVFWADVVRAAPQRPLLLIPGFGGSVLRTEKGDGSPDEHLWLRLTQEDKYLREYLVGKYNPGVGTLTSLTHPDAMVKVPMGNFGADAVTALMDYIPDSPFTRSIHYFKPLITFLEKKMGYVLGESLFVFPYDWRLLNNGPGRMKDMDSAIATAIHLATQAGVYTNQDDKKVDVLTHSMGGLVFQSYLAHVGKGASDTLGRTIVVACPHIGAGAEVFEGLISGGNFGFPAVVGSWEGIKKWSGHQASLTMPAMTDLGPWSSISDWPGQPPVIRVQYQGKSTADTIEGADIWTFLTDVNEKNTYKMKDGSIIPWPLDQDMLADVKKAREERVLLPGRPEKVYYFNGISHKTMYNLDCTKFPIKKPSDLLGKECVSTYVDGDGTVPITSARHSTQFGTIDGSKEIVGTHVGIVSSQSLFNYVKDVMDGPL